MNNVSQFHSLIEKWDTLVSSSMTDNLFDMLMSRFVVKQFGCMSNLVRDNNLSQNHIWKPSLLNFILNIIWNWMYKIVTWVCTLWHVIISIVHGGCMQEPLQLVLGRFQQIYFSISIMGMLLKGTIVKWLLKLLQTASNLSCVIT
jgi:hypothetical protein